MDSSHTFLSPKSGFLAVCGNDSGVSGISESKFKKSKKNLTAFEPLVDFYNKLMYFFFIIMDIGRTKTRTVAFRMVVRSASHSAIGGADV